MRRNSIRLFLAVVLGAPLIFVFWIAFMGLQFDTMGRDAFLKKYLGIEKVQLWNSESGDGDGIPSSTEGVPKIGFHTANGGNPNGIEGYIDSLDTAGIPVVIKSVDNAGPLLYAQNKANGVPHVLIFRSTGNDVPDYNKEPEVAAAEHWAWHISRFPPELNKNKVWLETLNEVDKERSEWLARFAIETADLARRDGFKWAAFGWSSGEPEIVEGNNDWMGPDMLRFLEIAGYNRDRIAIAVHEYCFTVSDVCMQSSPHLMGRYREIFKVADAHGFPRPVVIITEWGWEYVHVPSPSVAIKHMDWANDIYDDDPELIGAAIWYLGPNFGNIHNETNALIEPVTNWALSKKPPGSTQVLGSSTFRRLSKPVRQVDNPLFESEEAANSWGRSWGADIDLGMQFAILEGESAGGTNLGSCSGRSAAVGFSPNELDDVNALLAHWQKHDIRSHDGMTAMMIASDYSDYTGHCSAGEIGASGFLPSTAWKVCNGLQTSSDPRVKGCNFFNSFGGAHAKVWWLNAINYSASLSRQGKFDALYGWNRSVSYRWQLIDRAEAINQELADGGYEPGEIEVGGPPASGGLFSSITVYTYNPADFNIFQHILFWVADQWDLLPDNLYSWPNLPGWFSPPSGNQENIGVPPPMTVDGWVHPYPGSYFCGRSYGQVVDYGVHEGVDLCKGVYPWYSAPVFAAHSGTVQMAGSTSICGVGVILSGTDDEGQSIRTMYCHASAGTLAFRKGDTVEAGQQLFMSGDTGQANGIHLHFQVEVGGVWVNPSGYLLQEN